MPLPYLVTTLLFALVALLAALDVSFVNFNFLNAFAQLRWLRVHFITLGIITQVIFGLLPGLSASLANLPRPAMRWDIWLALNVGLVTLAIGIFGINQPFIFIGGTLIFIAASLLLYELWPKKNGRLPDSLKFYLSGVSYLLLGIFIGTGLWLNWSAALHIQVPLEAHIHANSWGFMSLVFAGLLVDFVPLIAGKPLASPRVISGVFWGMFLGAFGLVLGPWLGGSLPPTVAGIVLHLSATFSLVWLLFKRLREGGKLGIPGSWHLLGAYLWIILPVLMAPLIILGVLEGGPIEATAPQALIYGWVLQFGIALIPLAARRMVNQELDPTPGGCWGSLAAANVGSLLVWASIFISPARGVLDGIGFALFALALVHPGKELFEIIQYRYKTLDQA